ncbi:MAG: transglutaminase-like cysteine peptidase [Hoeflea sp.]|nr:transglutaminase-like cysteine peptidase [Rhodobiaceae bacterium]MCC0036949.1 transglutaminase-like cysteine peptidase [Hoeflea sp.]
MYSQVKKAIIRTNTTLAISLLCASAALANVYEIAGTKPQALALPGTPSIFGKAKSPFARWLVQARPATTLRLTRAGLAPIGLDLDAAGLSSASLRLPALAAETARDPIVTASIPAAAAPAGDAVTRAAARTANQTVSQAVRQDLPLFGAHRIRFGKIMSGARISGLIRKAAASGASAICINRCADLAARLDLGAGDITAQLRHVSASVNNLVAYRTDEQNHGRLDQWSTPNETLARASGDCEDYAILKMAVLARLGVPVNAMEIVVVKDTRRRLFHAVLSVALKDRTVILDNMTDAVEADTEKRTYAPLFSLSGSANYIFGYKGGKQNLTASLKNMASIAPGAGF